VKIEFHSKLEGTIYANILLLRYHF